MSARIRVLPDGRPVRASGPCPGSMHDVAAPGASGLLDGPDPFGWIAGKGYVGRGMITSHKKPPTANSTRRRRRRTGTSTGTARWSSGPSPTSSPEQSIRAAYGKPLHIFDQTITAFLVLYVFKITP